MKTTNKNFKKNLNLITVIRYTVLSFGIFALAMACKGPNDESSTNSDSIDSVKRIEMPKADTIVKQDTVNKMDVKATKP